MSTQQKLDYIENYLQKYFDGFVLKDIELIRRANLEFTIPYVLLVSTGIDFLGSLAKGFKNTSYEGSCYFIEEWMSRKNALYKDKRMSKIIYISGRCGASHQSIYKKEVESTSQLYPQDKHLYHMVDVNGKDRILIHALQFVDDFIDAQRLFRQEYIASNADNVYQNLEDMLEEPTIDGFQGLINELKGKGLTFKAEDTIQHSPRIKSYDKSTKEIIDISGNKVEPSKPPTG